MKKILIGQLGVYGDCLYATTIAHQIKQDNPNCELTWAIGSNYADILVGNPDVDQVWTYPIKDRWEVTRKWFDFVEDAEYRRRQYDEVYFIQTYPGGADNFYGCAREAMFRKYSRPITVPLNPIIRLSPIEVERVRAFANTFKLFDYKNAILFECTPQSNQSFLTMEMAVNIAKTITIQFPAACILMSHKSPKMSYLIDKADEHRIIDASVLSFRENAELTKYCTLLVGTGSGITQLCQSDWAKPLPTVQLLTQHTVASILWDHNWFHLPTDSIIELVDVNEMDVVNCIGNIFENGFATAKSVPRNNVTPDFTEIRFHMMFETARLTGHPLDIIGALGKTIQDYGMTPDLFRFLGTFPKNVIKLVEYRMAGVK
jgi:hypothetical protein